MPKVKGISGRWNELTRHLSHRLLNPEIANLASLFAKRFLPDNVSIEPSQTLRLFDYKTGYWLAPGCVTARTLSGSVQWILSHYNLNEGETVVLSNQITLLRNIDYFYRQTSEHSTTRTFESREEYVEVMQKRKVPIQNESDYQDCEDNSDSDKMAKAQAELDLRSIRRVAKVHFTTDTPHLKFATIPSFKGWEADSVILILDQASDRKNISGIGRHALTYTAITRARKNLFILNISNTEYDEFFRQHINTSAE